MLSTKADTAAASLQKSSDFASVLAVLRRSWSIELRDNRVIVDLLPLPWLVRAESVYFCSLTARLGDGVCFCPNPELTPFIRHRLRLRVSARGFLLKTYARRAASGDCSASVLNDMQDICLDHAIYTSLTTAKVDRRKWLVSRSHDSVQFVCLSEPSNIRTIKVELVAQDGTSLENDVEVEMRKIFIQNKGEVVEWLLRLP